jgi:two-component system cell cycle sensor histidine kinase/response regulator CckA
LSSEFSDPFAETSGPDPDDLRMLFELSRTGALILEAEELRVLSANDSARLSFELPEKLVGRRLGDLVVGLSNANAEALLRRLRQGLIDHLVIETVHRTSWGSLRPVELRFVYAAEPSPRYFVLVFDTLERSEPNELVVRRERLRDALAEILRVLNRIEDRDELYREACRIAVDRGGFRMAWIGIVDQATGEVESVASAGDSEGYVDRLHLNVRHDPRGPGMTVTAIVTKQPVAIADPRVDPMFTTLKREVQERGFQSAVSLPLIVEGRSIGALTVYGGVVNTFGAIEVELLQHLADDISFKLEVIAREERRRAAEAERDRLAAVVEQAGELVIITDRDRRIVYTNPAFTQIMGFASEEVQGRRTEFLAGSSQSSEVGRQIAGAIREGGSWDGVTRSRRKDGRDTDLQMSISPRLDDSGTIVGSIIIGRDVSREKSLEAQLMQAQKMEAVGRLAGGIAHDFNNLLTAISGYAEILKMELGPDDSRTEDVAEIQRAAVRATQLTRQLLAFGRRQVLMPRPLDPREVVIDIVPMLRRLIGEDLELVVEIVSGLGPIMADPNQLDQVLVNLALNGRDAMPSGGRLTIEGHEVDVDEAFASTHLWAHVGSYVVLSVRDTGEGMTEEVRRQVFEPFFTTKGPGKGTGLGLATVLGIVEQSNGYVEVDSEPGRGSTFHIYLPKVAPAPIERPEETAPTISSPGSGSLLVLEDEAPVRSLACRILRDAGYVVLEAATGEEALAIEATNSGRIDLLFTDVVLPDMNGHQVAEVLRYRRPEMAVLYASGYDHDMVAGQGNLGVGVGYMSKPYSREELLGRVGELVGGGADRLEDAPA